MTKTRPPSAAAATSWRAVGIGASAVHVPGLLMSSGADVSVVRPTQPIVASAASMVRSVGGPRKVRFGCVRLITITGFVILVSPARGIRSRRASLPPGVVRRRPCCPQPRPPRRSRSFSKRRLPRARGVARERPERAREDKGLAGQRLRPGGRLRLRGDDAHLLEPFDQGAVVRIVEEGPDR